MGTLHTMHILCSFYVADGSFSVARANSGSGCLTTIVRKSPARRAKLAASVPLPPPIPFRSMLPSSYRPLPLLSPSPTSIASAFNQNATSVGRARSSRSGASSWNRSLARSRAWRRSSKRTSVEKGKQFDGGLNHFVSVNRFIDKWDHVYHVERNERYSEKR